MHQGLSSYAVNTTVKAVLHPNHEQSEEKQGRLASVMQIDPSIAWAKYQDEKRLLICAALQFCKMRTGSHRIVF